MPFSTKHIAASLLGNAAIVAAKRLHTDNKNGAEETVENADKNNPFMPRRLYQEENNLEGLDSINLDDVELSLRLDKSSALLKNDKESILRDHVIQDSSSSNRRDMGILPDKGSQEAYRIRRRLEPATKSTKAPKATNAPSEDPGPTKKPKSSKDSSDSSAPSSMPSAIPSDSSAPSSVASAIPSDSSAPSSVASAIPSDSSAPSSVASAIPSDSSAPSSVPSAIPSECDNSHPYYDYCTDFGDEPNPGYGDYDPPNHGYGDYAYLYDYYYYQ